MKSFQFHDFRKPVDTLQLVSHGIAFMLQLGALAKAWDIGDHYVVVLGQVLRKSYPVVFIGSKTMDQQYRFPFTTFQIHDLVIVNLDFLPGQTGIMSPGFHRQIEQRLRQKEIDPDEH